jgi:hypothetical protein
MTFKRIAPKPRAISHVTPALASVKAAMAKVSIPAISGANRRMQTKPFIARKLPET